MTSYDDWKDLGYSVSDIGEVLKFTGDDMLKLNFVVPIAHGLNFEILCNARVDEPVPDLIRQFAFFRTSTKVIGNQDISSAPASRTQR